MRGSKARKDKQAEERTCRDTPTSIVLQIVKEEGYLRSKQIYKKNKMPSAEGALQNCSRCFSQFVALEGLRQHDCLGGGLFPCDLCPEKLTGLGELLQHIQDMHQDVQVPQEYEMLLNKQLCAIDKIKNTANELVATFKFDAVKALLDTSKKSLDSFKMDIFGRGDINVFKTYITFVYNQINCNLFTNMDEEYSDTVAKKADRKSLPYVSNKEQKKCKTIKRCKKKRKSNNLLTRKTTKRTKRSFFNNEFSSEDELCLKESVLKLQKDLKISSAQDDDNKGSEELCLQFYAVPYKTDGELITLYEMEHLRSAVKTMWDGILVDLSPFAHVMIRRFERETDQVLPDDALFAGYVSKENKCIFEQSKKFSDIFNESLLLNEEMKCHKVKNKLYKRSMEDKMEISHLSYETETETFRSGINKVDGSDELPTALSQSESDNSCENNFNKALGFSSQLYKVSEQTLTLATSAYKTNSELKNVDRPTCTICQRTFTSLGRLSQHMASLHQDKKTKKNK